MDILHGLKPADVTPGVLRTLNEALEAALKAAVDSSLREVRCLCTVLWLAAP